ncbi:MAG: hypothetical protein ABIO67_11580 [Mycobacteriales bacterium]
MTENNPGLARAALDEQRGKAKSEREQMPLVSAHRTAPLYPAVGGDAQPDETH